MISSKKSKNQRGFKLAILLICILIIIPCIFLWYSYYIPKKPRYIFEAFELHNNSILRQVLKPNHTQVFDGFYVRIPETVIKTNSHGFRGKEVTLRKPDSVKRIIVLGDSFVFGQGLEEDETYPFQLETQLRAKTGGAWEVLNFGIPGYNTLQESELLKLKGLEFSPELVTVVVNGDDIFYPIPLNEIHISDGEEYNMKSELEKYKNEFQEQILMNDSYVDREFVNIKKPILELKTLAQEYNFVLFVIDYTKTYGDRIIDLCDEENILWMSFGEFDSRNQEMIISRHDVHPSKKAHQMLADMTIVKLENNGLI